MSANKTVKSQEDQGVEELLKVYKVYLTGIAQTVIVKVKGVKI